MTSQTASVVISGLVAITGIAAGVILPFVQRKQARVESLRQERLRAYSDFLTALSGAELSLTFLGRDDPGEPLDDEQVQHLDDLRSGLSAAHAANLGLYLLAPYLLAETARSAIREVEARSMEVLERGKADMEDRWWESTLDQMRDDLGTVSRIPQPEDFKKAGL